MAYYSHCVFDNETTWKAILFEKATEAKFCPTAYFPNRIGFYEHNYQGNTKYWQITDKLCNM